MSKCYCCGLCGRFGGGPYNESRREWEISRHWQTQSLLLVMLDRELAATCDVVEFWDRLLPFLPPGVLGKRLLGSNFSLKVGEEGELGGQFWGVFAENSPKGQMPNSERSPEGKNSPWAALVYSRRTRKRFQWYSPLTCCSSVIITSTAILRMPSFVWGLSVLRCDVHIRPNSLSASLISRILILMIAKRSRYSNWLSHWNSWVSPLPSVVGLPSFLLLAVLLTGVHVLVVFVLIATGATARRFAAEFIMNNRIGSEKWIVKSKISRIQVSRWCWESIVGSTHYRLCLFCPLALLAADPLTAWLLLGFVSASGGSFRFSGRRQIVRSFPVVITTLALTCWRYTRSFNFDRDVKGKCSARILIETCSGCLILRCLRRYEGRVATQTGSFHTER